MYDKIVYKRCKYVEKTREVLRDELCNMHL